MQVQTLPLLNAESPLNKLRIRLVQFVLTLLFLIGIFFSLSFFVSGNNIFSGANAIAPITSLFSLGLFITVSRGQLINIISVLANAYIIAIGVYLFVLADNNYLLFLILSLATVSVALLLDRVSFW